MTQFVVTLERTIAAPRAKVYRAWLDPTVLARWMGPEGSSVVHATVDERVGGAHHLEMLGPDGAYYEFVSVIDELVPDERIVLTFRFDQDGEDTLLTLTFRDAEGGGTALHLQHERITLRPPLDGSSVDTGWNETLTKLQAYFAEEEPS
ncbi:MAG: SRPBCC domain-containing protein [Ilumatobacteraceae bacterium]